MVCPHSGGSSQLGGSRGLSHRQFSMAAVAIGGTSALAACLDRGDDQPAGGDDDDGERGNDGAGDAGGPTEDDRPDYFDPEEGVPFVYRNLDRDEAQFAWNRYLDTNQHGNPEPPRHQILLMADYRGVGMPTDDKREVMEAAFETLETAFEWSNDGLLFTVAYSPTYFDRFDDPLPESVDLPEPEPLAEFEDPALDDYEVCIHLGSDYPEAVLGAEEALFGDLDEVNGVPVETDLTGVLEKRDRRTGFIGPGLPAENQDVDGIPDSKPVDERAPLFMGFQCTHAVTEYHPYHGETEDTYIHNQNSEYGVMIDEGRFAGGTTQHVSRIHLDLEEWYDDHTLDERLHRMFATQVTVDVAGEVGEEDQVHTLFPGTDEHVDDIDEMGLVGHSEKLIRGRDRGLQPLLRRDFNTTDGDRAGVHFVSLQDGIDEFVRMRTLMNGTGFRDGVDGIETRKNNGILEFISVQNRANFLVPPRDLRSLPTPTPPGMDVSFTWSPYIRGVGTEVTFDASDATVKDDEVVEYRWDFSDDGEFDATVADPVVTHTFDEAGHHPVTLEIVDGQGRTASATITVPVDIVESWFTWLPTTPAPGQSVTFDATDSSGDVVEYRWDFTGDGEVDEATEEPVTNHTFDEAGDHPVTLEVDGGEGHSDESTRIVTVS